MWVDIIQARADEMEKKIETQMEPKKKDRRAVVGAWA